MKPVGLRWLIGAIAILALVLAACSSPQTAQTPTVKNPVVELDGYQAKIDVANLDLAPLSLFGSETQNCTAGQAHYAMIPVPMLGRDYTGKWVRYTDVFFMPRDWNHKLALYAHGYVDPTDPNWMQDLIGQLSGTDGAGADPLIVTRDMLLCEGYALGISTYAAPGYAVQEGIIDTHLLNAVFRFIFWRRPAETYVFGSSMGGLITVALAEKFPWRYDGALPTCGPIGGSMTEFAYIGNVRLLFEQANAYPGVLQPDFPGWQPPDAWVPPGTTWEQLVGGALTSDSTGLHALANTGVQYTADLFAPLLQTPQNYAGELPPGLAAALAPYNDLFSANALLHALRYYVVGAGDIMDRGGGIPWTNMGVAYVGLRTGDFVSATTDTVPPPGYGTAAAYFGSYYQPTGHLAVPTLSLHTPIDPDVPTFHEFIYQHLVQSQLGPSGASSMLHSYLIQGTVPADLAALAAPATLPARIPYGHCNFAPSDLVTAMNALDSRVVDHAWPDLSAAGFIPLEPNP